MPEPEAKVPKKPGPYRFKKSNNTSGLKRGGRKPKEFITQPELDFCNYLLDGASKTDAARWAGFPDHASQRAFELLRKPIVQKTLAELQEQRKKESVERTAQLREERRVFAHHNSLYLARKMKTHKFRGDADIVKHAENLLKSVGEIQPNTVKNTAVAGALAAAPDPSVPHLFVPAWKKAITHVVEGDSPAQLESGEPGSGSVS